MLFRDVCEYNEIIVAGMILKKYIYSYDENINSIKGEIFMIILTNIIGTELRKIDQICEDVRQISVLNTH